MNWRWVCALDGRLYGQLSARSTASSMYNEQLVVKTQASLESWLRSQSLTQVSPPHSLLSYITSNLSL